MTSRPACSSPRFQESLLPWRTRRRNVHPARSSRSAIHNLTSACRVTPRREPPVERLDHPGSEVDVDALDLKIGAARLPPVDIAGDICPADWRRPRPHYPRGRGHQQTTRSHADRSRAALMSALRWLDRRQFFLVAKDAADTSALRRVAKCARDHEGFECSVQPNHPASVRLDMAVTDERGVTVFGEHVPAKEAG